MQPKNDDDSRNINVPARGQSASVSAPDRAAAAQLMRQQIDSIYDSDHGKNPYQQTHSEKTDHDAAGKADTSEWNQYHTQWQSYYQQYYERYYISQLNKRQQAIVPKSSAHEESHSSTEASNVKSEIITKDEAVNQLRSQIITEVKGRSHKIRKSRHFMPILAALTVALVFSTLQYNRFLVAQVKAYVSPGSISAQNIVLDPTTNLKVGPEPRLIIPKINVDAPFVDDVPSLEESVIQSKLKDGVVHYPIPGANSLPGQVGNTVILGHSSNDVFDDGDYKFVFVQLEKLEKGDTFYLNYKGIRHTYSVTEKKVIDPTEVSQLVIDTTKPLATLVTCTPPGTALKRLVVIAEQISPDPSKATAKAESTPSNSPVNISGNSPTIFERLFR